MVEILSRASHRFGFESYEVLWIIITALVGAFGLTISNVYGIFDVTGGEGVPSYVANLLLISAIVTLIIFFMVAMQKIIGLKLGYQVQFVPSLTASVIMLAVSFFSYGFVPLFFTGATKIDLVPKLRLGVFRGGVKHSDLAIISFAGTLGAILLVLPLAPIYLATDVLLFKTIIMLCNLAALFSLVPIIAFEKFPKMRGATPGLFMLVNRRTLFVLGLASVLAFTVLSAINVFSYIVSAIIGVFTSLVYYHSYESSKR